MKANGFDHHLNGAAKPNGVAKSAPHRPAAPARSPREHFDALAKEHAAVLRNAAKLEAKMLGLGLELAVTDDQFCRKCGRLFSEEAQHDGPGGARKGRRRCLQRAGGCGHTWTIDVAERST